MSLLKDFFTMDIHGADGGGLAGVNQIFNRVLSGLHGKIVQIDDCEIGKSACVEAEAAQNAANNTTTSSTSTSSNNVVITNRDNTTSTWNGSASGSVYTDRDGYDRYNR